MLIMRIVFFIIYLSISIGGFAQNDTSSIVPDSLTLGTAPHLPKKVAFFDKLPHGKLFNSTYIGAPLVIGGLIVKHQDKKFRKLRNDFMPQFHRTFDNYTQYAPAIVMVGMKAAGIESRSSWGRMLLSDAFSVSMMAGIVQGLKHTTSVVRPDGSNDHSFPSGHTATAFMTATMLNKEYGYKSPWIGFGAYSVATATGLMRIANNKHWLSDVMVGAGIGIMATEFGYWLADLIFKEKGLNRKDEDVADDDFDDECNSFLDLYMGFNLPLSDYDHYVDNAYQTSTGTTIGLEGSWFINRYIGAGGRLSFSNVQYIVNEDDASEKSYNYFTVMAGPYFSIPLTRRFSIGSKLLGGGVFYPEATINNIPVGNNQGFSCGTGLSLKYNVRKRLSINIFLDYNLLAPASKASGEYMHIMTLGAKTGLRL
jgi:hypothetical protein